LLAHRQAETRAERASRHPIARLMRRDAPLGVVTVCEDAMHYAVSALLIVLAAAVLVHTVADFASDEIEFAQRVTGAVNGVLFVIIVLEILRTVMAHFEDAGLQLKPFLTIGIISAVRHILTLGAQLSQSHSAERFRQTQIELGVNAAVVVTLVAGLILVRRTDALDHSESEG
jgi:uncharacterized membrane protein (DUF373 family)